MWCVRSGACGVLCEDDVCGVLCEMCRTAYHFSESLAIQHRYQGNTVHSMVTMSFVETMPTSYCANAHSVSIVFSAVIMSSTLSLSKVLEGVNGAS